MPSKSAKQHKFMMAVAHGMKPRSGKGPSVKVAKEFVAADSMQSGNPGVDETIFKSKRVASAGKHPKAGGKRR